MSAAAVVAVRVVLRVALLLASRPDGPPKRRAGPPTILASGRISRPAIMITPRKSTIAPIPTRASDTPIEPDAQRARKAQDSRDDEDRDRD